MLHRVCLVCWNIYVHLFNPLTMVLMRIATEFSFLIFHSLFFWYRPPRNGKSDSNWALSYCWDGSSKGRKIIVSDKCYNSIVRNVYYGTDLGTTSNTLCVENVTVRAFFILTISVQYLYTATIDCCCIYCITYFMLSQNILSYVSVITYVFLLFPLSMYIYC